MMARKNKAKKLTPVERLAIMVMEAYTAAYVRENPRHDAPSWEQIKSLARHTPYLAIAQELLKKGIQVPLPEK